MSLRAEIHEAVDEVTPRAPLLRSKAASYVDAETRRGSASKPTRRWRRPLRGSLGLVAAALVLVVLAGAFFAGRYWRDLHATPQPVHTQPSLKSLEERPLVFPTLESGAPCPTSPIILYPRGGLAIGDGPVYFIDRNPVGRSSWGSWEQLRFVYWARGPGIVLIRGWDLGGNQAAAFVQDPLGPSKITAAGRVLGTDQVLDRRVQKRAEAYFQDPGSSPPKTPSLFPLETVFVGLPTGAPGCLGLQFDGEDFTESFVISWADTGL